MAFLYRYDWYVVPEIFEDNPKEDKILKEFSRILNYLDNSYIKKLCGDIALEVIKKGAYYGYIVYGQKGMVMQQLPIKYCRSRYFVNNLPAIEFNMRFFDNTFRDPNYRARVIKLFPPEFAKGYVLAHQEKLKPDYTGDTNGLWYLLEPNMTVKFNINNNELYIVFVSKDNKLFNEGDSVKIKNEKYTVNGEIYKKYNKNGYFTITVKITQQNKEIYDTRESEFDIIYKQMEALRIPKESLVKKDNKKGVYVINEESNKPEFVEIKGSYFENDKYIYIDFRKNEINEVDTVKLHDRIILKPNFINKRVSKIN